MNAALDVDPTWIAGDRLAVQELTNVSSLEALAPEWEDLCSHCDCTPFQRPQWVIPWLQHLYGGGDICILTVRDGRERLIGIAPLFSHFFNGAPQLKQISFVGAGVTDYLDFIVRKEYALAATEALLGRLDARQPRWDICDLQEVRPESTLLSVSYPPGWDVEISDCSVCPVVTLPERAEDLGAQLPVKLRNELRRSVRRLRELGPVDFEIACSEKTDEYLDALFSLHAARWNLRGERGMTDRVEVRLFHRAVARNFMQSGHLRLYGLRIKGLLSAVLYTFVDGGRSYYYLGGFDPNVARFSPGSLLLRFAMQQSVSERRLEFDFLRDPQLYKYRWGAKDRVNKRLLIRR